MLTCTALFTVGIIVGVVVAQFIAVKKAVATATTEVQSAVSTVTTEVKTVEADVQSVTKAL